MDIQVIPLSKEYLDHYDDVKWEDHPSVRLWESEMEDAEMESKAKCGGRKGKKKRGR